MKAFRATGVPVLFGVVFYLTAITAMAELRSFTIDQAQSTLTIGGTFQGITLQQQGPGSLTAHYSGTILADVTGATITFVGGSVIAGMDSGTWQPGTNGAVGSAPANYGATASTAPPFVITGLASFRSLLYDVTSGALPITAGSFPAQTMVFSFPSNAPSALDYRYSGFLNGSGRRTPGGASTNNLIVSGTVSNLNGNLILTIPANIVGSATLATANDFQYSLQGQFVAVAAGAPLRVTALQYSGGQLNFTITTVSNESYSILGSTNLITWSSTNDQFVATNTVSTRSINLPALPRQFFRIRKN